MNDWVSPRGLGKDGPRISNLLVAAKMNVTGADAMKAGAALAERAGAHLSVISVIEPRQTPEPLNPEEGQRSEWMESMRNRIRRFIKTEFEGIGYEPKRVHVSSGNPAGLVAIFAEQTASELLIIGPHRASDFDSILPGSPGEKIIRESKVPVLALGRNGSTPFKRILVAVDLSLHSQILLDWASRLAWIDDSEIRVVHSEALWRGPWRSLTFQSSRTFRRPSWRRLMRRFLESELPGNPQIVLRKGHPGRAVLREARTWNADLLVIGTRRLSLPFSMRIGRTTKYLLRHGGRSILAVSDQLPTRPPGVNPRPFP